MLSISQAMIRDRIEKCIRYRVFQKFGTVGFYEAQQLIKKITAEALSELSRYDKKIYGSELAGICDKAVDASLRIYQKELVKVRRLSFGCDIAVASSAQDGYIPGAKRVIVFRGLSDTQNEQEDQAAIFAERAGIQLILDIPRIPKGLYVDTNKNRETIMTFLREHPDFVHMQYVTDDPGFQSLWNALVQNPKEFRKSAFSTLANDLLQETGIYEFVVFHSWDGQLVSIRPDAPWQCLRSGIKLSTDRTHIVGFNNSIDEISVLTGQEVEQFLDGFYLYGDPDDECALFHNEKLERLLGVVSHRCND